MPWSIKRDDRCPADKPWGVFKDADDSLEGCHATEVAAKQQQAALYASEDREEPPMTQPPRDDLVRAIFPGGELRDGEADGMPTMTGHLAVFDQWTRIDSAFEGTFMERLAPGAFARTIENNRAQMRVTFNHGKDPSIGNKVLGLPDVLREEDAGVYYEVPLFDTSYNRELLPGLRANAYGSSFRFRINKEDFRRSPGKSAYNPDGIPERTVREVSMSEFGPVTFPAYTGATAGVRSLTDDYLIDRLVASPHIQALLRGTALPDVGPEPAHSDEGTRKPEAPPPEVADQPTRDPAKAGSSLVRRFRTDQEWIEWITRS